LRPRARPWVPVETAAAAFGQGVSVTNVQMAMALAAIANRGRLLQPILVKRVTDSAGTVLTDATPRLRRKVISPRVARLVTEMMTSVTEGEGTGVEAAIDGFRVAGKTATAQKTDPATGRYNDTHYVASFFGFVPASRPRIVVAVVIDEPMAGTTAGGAVAAPVFRRVAERTLRYLGVRPRGTKSVKLTKVAEYAKDGDPATNAYAVLQGAKGAPPPPVTDVADDTAPTQRGRTKVPDIIGLPVRAALRATVEAGLAPVVHGSGRLSRTDPPASTQVPKGSKLILVFESQI
jgi:cell division protein FtsI (penicillin-binding protein 3)